MKRRVPVECPRTPACLSGFFQRSRHRTEIL